MEKQVTQNNQYNPKDSKKKAREIKLPDFKFYHKTTIIKSVYCWWENRQIKMKQNREPKNRSTAKSLQKETMNLDTIITYLEKINLK